MARKSTTTTTKPKNFKPGTTVEQMLEVKLFDKLIEDGDVFTVEYAAERTGYTVQHIRKLCRQRRIPHINRGALQYLFLPEHIKAILKVVFKTVKATRA